ncbi:MAG TPA: hypothetical protein VGR82_04720 [Methylomirabilota bacterium]|jgi:hypothetical protein|nr:hypothetical protein [Methylomirabilota bacterium]
MHQFVRAALGCAVSVLLCAGAAAAQNRTAPPSPSPEQMQQQMSMMGPAMAAMTENMYAGMLRALAKPESADQLATFMKNYRDALLAKGFTREEALQIVRGTGMPSMPSR